MLLSSAGFELSGASIHWREAGTPRPITARMNKRLRRFFSAPGNTELVDVSCFGFILIASKIYLYCVDDDYIYNLCVQPPASIGTRQCLSNHDIRRLGGALG